MKSSSVLMLLKPVESKGVKLLGGQRCLGPLFSPTVNVIKVISPCLSSLH